MSKTTFLPIVREIEADLETPVSVYLKLRDQGPSFLLESVTGGESLARYSFIGLNPHSAYIVDDNNVVRRYGRGLTQSEVLEGGQNPLAVLQDVLKQYDIQDVPGLPRLKGGMVGYLSYDVVRFFEPSLDLPLHELPDGIFLLTDTIVAFDHTRGQAVLIALAHGTSAAAISSATERIAAIAAKLQKPVPPIKPMVEVDPDVAYTHSEAAYSEMVLKAQEHIKAGDIFQGVLSQKVTRATGIEPFQIYRQLRRLNPSPYMFFFDFADLYEEPFYLIGASPEIHVRLEDGNTILRPIAGTRPRGKTEAEDIAFAKDLLADPKEIAEHVMLVDLGRNDLGRVCEFGSVKVTDMMVIERYSHVMHIVSQVEGDANANIDGFDLIAATFPAGTVSGAPKVRAMEIIAELEDNPRGPYAGVVGYIGFDGSMDTCIALRTLYMVGNRVTAQAGAGVVADSVPHNEFIETVNKAMAAMNAIDVAEEKERKK